MTIAAQVSKTSLSELAEQTGLSEADIDGIINCPDRVSRSEVELENKFEIHRSFGPDPN